MLEKIYDSRDLPVSDREEAWRAVTASVLAVDVSVGGATEFEASLRAAGLGEVQVTAQTHTSLTSRPRPGRQSAPETYAVALVLRGRQGISQNGREASLGAGDLVLFSASRPREAVVEARREPAASVLVRVPRSVLPLPPDRVNRLLAVRMSGREGVGCLLAGFLTHLTADSTSCRPADGQRLGGVLVDLITAWLAHHLDAQDQVPEHSRRRAQFLEIQHFIHRHLDDDELSPADVAAAHHISLRTLHRLFHAHAHGATVASYIRHQRLTRVRRDLADPHMAARPVHAIAARWGFPQPADFTRVFRTAYGMPPGEYRRLCLRGAVGAPS
ncbi:AraC family transcriptional regulator [Streptomyces ruber]|uniref:AraC family transcriptional regulator n=2 Tax=Streptomyces TaxID=1883 RepID=A0A918BPI7_9ACTN|nr:helix-turn-helix domain-containing protein [Streptomyces ruber]GGQ81273.1 AraC family transcriptional regulator [Streptomyces ruber]